MSDLSEALQLFITNTASRSRLDVGGEIDLATIDTLRDHLASYLAGDGDGADLVDHDHIIDALNDMYFDRGLDHPLPYGPT